MQEILKTIKYQGHYYTKGTLLKIDDKDKAEFIKKEIISTEVEKVDSEKAPNKPLNKDTIELSVEETKEPETAEEVPENEFEQYTIAELKIMLDNQGIEYKNRATKQELIELLK